MFKKYQHVERFGNTEVENINLGECFIFPKIDGTNASIWMENGEIKAGSRNRELTLDNDNAGFLHWALDQDNIKSFFIKNPKLRLFGEWLVPHSLKTYREDAWRKFYVFDVCVDVVDEVGHLSFNIYKEYLEEFGVDYISPIAVVTNGTYEQFVKATEKNTFLIEDGKGFGEGIVIKNYDFVNKFKRTVWAKIVTNEFKEKHTEEMGATYLNAKKMVEEDISIEYVTETLCIKVYEKIKNEKGWSSKNIPELLNTIYYDLIREEMWEILKKYKDPKIDFKTLRHFAFKQVRYTLKEIF